MKNLIQIAANYGKILKSDAEDQNEESIYAEVNLILSEPDYKIDGYDVRKGLKISDVELNVSKDTAKKIYTAFKKIHSKLVELEKRES